MPPTALRPAAGHPPTKCQPHQRKPRPPNQTSVHLAHLLTRDASQMLIGLDNQPESGRQTCRCRAGHTIYPDTASSHLSSRCTRCYRVVASVPLEPPSEPLHSGRSSLDGRLEAAAGSTVRRVRIEKCRQRRGIWEPAEASTKTAISSHTRCGQNQGIAKSRAALPTTAKPRSSQSQLTDG